MLIKIGEEMKVSRLLAAALAAALAASAHAQDEPVSVLYAGGSFGQAHWRPGCAGTSTCEDTDNTVRVFGGYQINRVLAAEVAYTNLGIIGNATSRSEERRVGKERGSGGWPDEERRRRDGDSASQEGR